MKKIFVMSIISFLFFVNVFPVRLIYGIENNILKLQIGNKMMYVNDVPQEVDVPPIIVGTKVFVPLRYIVEPLGATITWNDAEKKAAVCFKGTLIELCSGSRVIVVIKKDKLWYFKPLTVPFLIIKGRIMVPVEFRKLKLYLEIRRQEWYYNYSKQKKESAETQT